MRKKKIDNYSSVLERKIDLGKYVRRVPITDEDLILADTKVQQIEDENLRQKLKTIYLKSIQLTRLKKDYGWIACKRCGRLTPKEKPICFNCLREIKEEKEKLERYKQMLENVEERLSKLA